MKGSDYDAPAADIQRAAEKFYALRYQMGNGGNLSVRLPGRRQMLVKGTDTAFDEVRSETLVITDFEGNPLDGNLRPSKEAQLHGVLYKELEGVNAVMHCHSPYATAWAAGHEELLLSTHHSALKLKGRVPVFDTHSYAVPIEYFPQILKFFTDHPGACAFLLRGHGQVTVGKDMREAAYLAELVEETAQISILSYMAKPR